MKKIVRTFRLLLITGYCCFSSYNTYAQREVQYAQYLVNPLAINPAATGIRENFHFNAVLRRQFVAGIQGLPVTQSFAMDGSVANGKVGLGLQGLNDRVSVNVAVFGSTSYIIKLSEYQKISIGVLGGINVLPSRSAINIGGGINKALASAGVGIYYQDELFFGGISMPEILKQSYGYNNTGGLLNYQRPIFVQLGLKMEMSEELNVVPSILITKPEQGKIRTDLNALMHYKNTLMAGVSARLGSVTYFQVLLGYDISKNIRIGYTYNSRRVEDFYGNSTSVPGAGKGIHEIVFTLQPNPRSN
ncbi:PorP/SprF family type IX secretion system membrane protein [Runella slithyformis]|uniref:Membrane protein n=1 Tax=Runella slithyformis (strain ATCC 29530 / DSM 19594 / LMG 11500 / NCIMB 11436 / LSU 4) TaxID=761193 RepID=A0A7U3ZLJ3_RUNSL|nr:PorP/SprF family type IX secretion system membrane protein [Runella slithyformis]AEI49387.1 putative membrane protein [Runella slithyformis DSM 19594]